MLRGSGSASGGGGAAGRHAHRQQKADSIRQRVSRGGKAPLKPAKTFKPVFIKPKKGQKLPPLAAKLNRAVKQYNNLANPPSPREKAPSLYEILHKHHNPANKRPPRRNKLGQTQKPFIPDRGKTPREEHNEHRKAAKLRIKAREIKRLQRGVAAQLNAKRERAFRRERHARIQREKIEKEKAKEESRMKFLQKTKRDYDMMQQQKRKIKPGNSKLGTLGIPKSAQQTAEDVNNNMNKLNQQKQQQPRIQRSIPRHQSIFKTPENTNQANNRRKTNNIKKATPTSTSTSKTLTTSKTTSDPKSWPMPTEDNLGILNNQRATNIKGNKTTTTTKLPQQRQRRAQNVTNVSKRTQNLIKSLRHPRLPLMKMFKQTLPTLQRKSQQQTNMRNQPLQQRPRKQQLQRRKQQQQEPAGGTIAQRFRNAPVRAKILAEQRLRKRMLPIVKKNLRKQQLKGFLYPTEQIKQRSEQHRQELQQREDLIKSYVYTPIGAPLQGLYAKLQTNFNLFALRTFLNTSESNLQSFHSPINPYRFLFNTFINAIPNISTRQFLQHKFTQKAQQIASHIKQFRIEHALTKVPKPLTPQQELFLQSDFEQIRNLAYFTPIFTPLSLDQLDPLKSIPVYFPHASFALPTTNYTNNGLLSKFTSQPNNINYINYYQQKLLRKKQQLRHYLLHAHNEERQWLTTIFKTVDPNQQKQLDNSWWLKSTLKPQLLTTRVINNITTTPDKAQLLHMKRINDTKPTPNLKIKSKTSLMNNNSNDINHQKIQKEQLHSSSNNNVQPINMEYQQQLQQQQPSLFELMPKQPQQSQQQQLSLNINPTTISKNQNSSNNNFTPPALVMMDNSNDDELFISTVKTTPTPPDQSTTTSNITRYQFEQEQVPEVGFQPTNLRFRPQKPLQHIPINTEPITRTPITTTTSSYIPNQIMKSKLNQRQSQLTQQFEQILKYINKNCQIESLPGELNSVLTNYHSLLPHLLVSDTIGRPTSPSSPQISPSSPSISPTHKSSPRRTNNNIVINNEDDHNTNVFNALQQPIKSNIKSMDRGVHDFSKPHGYRGGLVDGLLAAPLTGRF